MLRFLNGFYRNGATATDATKEVDGNFITGLHAFNGLSNQSGPMFRLYGDIASTTPDYWLNSAGDAWETGSNWSSGGPPGGGADAVFNLSSGTLYRISISTAQRANNFYVQNDKVNIDFDALLSDFDVNKTLSVGAQTSSGSPAVGELKFTNFGALTFVVPTAANIVVGANGGLEH